MYWQLLPIKVAASSEDGSAFTSADGLQRDMLVIVDSIVKRCPSSAVCKPTSVATIYFRAATMPTGALPENDCGGTFGGT